MAIFKNLCHFTEIGLIRNSFITNIIETIDQFANIEVMNFNWKTSTKIACFVAKWQNGKMAKYLCKFSIKSIHNHLQYVIKGKKSIRNI